LIQFDNVGKAFRSRKDRRQLVWPVRNFSTIIAEGESTGILVPEGGGKTTLVDLVGGTEIPTEGEIIRKGHISWPANFRGLFHAKMTGKQNLRFLTDVYGRDYAAAFEFMAEFTELGRYVDLPLKQYSGEQRNRLAMGALLAMDFQFILVDDVFEAGDGKFRRKITAHVKENPGKYTFFIATGNTRLVETYCDRAGVMHEGTVTFYDTIAEAIAVFEEVEQSLL
jgi:capsular polysaccharide transport system ATP-binding protein